MTPTAINAKYSRRDLSNPGTPDLSVTCARLDGRQFYRRFPEDKHEAADKIGSIAPDKRVQFWLGWYDERLSRWYGR